MKKTILAILLSTFMCGLTFAEEEPIFIEDSVEATERYSEITDEDLDGAGEGFSESESYIDCTDYLKGAIDYSDEDSTSDCIEDNNSDLDGIDAEEQLAYASEDNVDSLLSTCKEYTLEDGVEEGDLNSYLLICINNILSESGYKSIKSLPVGE